MSAVVQGKKARRIVLVLAGCLFLGALLLYGSIANNSELASITAMLRSHGYTVREDDLYIAGDYRDTTIAAILTGVDLDAAVAASLARGFPSDVDKRGDVVLILAATRTQDVITMYAVDGAMELCFVQRPGADAVEPLGGDAQ